MIIQAAPCSNTSSIGYTWDESWVLPYESIRSLVHKFAMLNRISMLDCKTLFKPEGDDREGCVTELGGQLSIQKMARIIGLGTSLDRNLVYGIAHPSDRQWLLSPYLRSCPVCSALGFHSIFHQITSITRCPIHHINLEVATCRACGSHELYDCMRTGTGKYGAGPYTCSKCGNCFWHPYDISGDSPHRNLLSISHEQKSRLDEFYDWFIASAGLAPNGASMGRWEGMARLLSFPPPIGMVPHKKSIYELRGREILVYRGLVIGAQPPESTIGLVRRNTSFSITKYGFRARGKSSRPWSGNLSNEPVFDDSGIIYKEDDRAIHDSLRPIYKSIRRHIAKVFLRRGHQRCARSIEKAMWWEPGPDSNTVICPWAFAYLFWRRRWEKHARVNYPNKFANWKNSLTVKISANEPSKNEWATQRIFGLECYWTFQECVLLARWMSSRQKFSWDSALIRGRMIPYWYIDLQTNPGSPSIYWWALQVIHSTALKLNVPMSQHHRDVASQVVKLLKI